MTELANIGGNGARTAQGPRPKAPNETRVMKDEHVQFWEKTFVTGKKWMAPKHRLWRRLIQQYKLDFAIRGLKASRIQKISQFYPLTRMIITSVAFQNPKVFMRVEENDLAFSADILERVANDALELMDVKPEVQQMLFDSLYCYRGWLKAGVNPPGDDDITPPYVANDAMQNGMVYWMRTSPFNVYPDPMTPPQKLGHARFIWEEMVVPHEWVMKDPRFRFKEDVKPMNEQEVESHILEETGQSAFKDEDEEAAWRDSRMDGKFVVLREVHDRMHRRRYTFNPGGPKQPIEDIMHPFLAGTVELERDPIEGDEKVVPNTFKPTGGYLVKNGFPYSSLALDMSHDELYGLPMMAYAEDTQKGIIESVSRRKNLLNRATRIILGRKEERKENPDIDKVVTEGGDLAIAWVQDVHNSFAELAQGNPPPDQLGYESDLRQYQEQILAVSQTAAGGPRVTATQASLQASFGQLNREWMQSRVGDVYEEVSVDTLRIMSDRRFTPKNFLVNVAHGDADPVFEAVTADMLKARFKIHIEAGSMKPMFEELEREDALALFNYLIALPEVPRPEAIKHLLRAFRVPNQEKLIGQAARWDAMRAAETENELMILWAMTGQPQPAPVHPQDDHQGHMPIHQNIQQSSQKLLQLPPEMQQVVMQQVQVHFQQHQQALQEKAQAGAGAGGRKQASGQISSISDQGNPVQSALGAIDSAVRSSAQELSQPNAINRAQN